MHLLRWREKRYFSVVDVARVLIEQPDYHGPRNYWKVLKNPLKKEGGQLVTACNQLSMKSPKDGKQYKTDVADNEQLLRIIQSIPSPKAKPFKIELARVVLSISETINPEQLLQ